MTKMAFSEFDSVYQDSVSEVWPHWSPTMQTEIARHCIAWSPGRTDFLDYLRVSSIRFYKAYCALADSGGRSVCDVGGFWGVWPMTLKKLGFDAAMTETLKYYGDAFRPLFEEIEKTGVEIFDYDPFDENAKLPREFDFVTVMAVLEHYPHSLRRLMSNVRRIAALSGRIFLEAPNIAYWPKRIALLRGASPLAELADIYNSEEPFIGHHHEFTIAEMRDLAGLAGLTIIGEDFYNYSLAGKSTLRLLLRHPMMCLAFALSPTSRECIAVVCEART
jgi:SAM-dependent methyltransferase